MHILMEYNRQYLGYTDYDPSDVALGETFNIKYILLSTLGNGISTNPVLHAWTLVHTHQLSFQERKTIHQGHRNKVLCQESY
jgi:hypothetical protein